MDTRKTRDLPARLESLRGRFERWRAAHRPRSRIPDELWASAVKATARYGLYRTSRALRLEYYSLKKRIEQQSTITAAPPKKAVGGRRSPVRLDARSAPTFVELAPVANGCECVFELEDAAGAKMRVHLKGGVAPDLAALGQSFWNSSP
jgi:hypothetical protein